jgi:hypothetical protein
MRKGLLCRLAVLLSVLTLVSCGANSPSSNPVSPAQAVAAAKAALVISYASGDSASSVTHNLTLLTSGAEGTTVAWASSRPLTIMENALVSLADPTMIVAVRMTPVSLAGCVTAPAIETTS